MKPEDSEATAELAEPNFTAPAPGPAPKVDVEEPKLAAGTRLGGRYRIERFVASGGMGDVYEAVDTELRSKLAVKTVRSRVAGDPTTMERVRREVQLARTVTDPHVCRIFDIGHADVDGRRITYITMELLEGVTLHHRLREHGAFGPAAAMPIAADVLGGLDAVHRAGVIHRDLKPENVLLVHREDREHAVLTDFGIARAEQTEAADGSALTEEGMLIGSPAFMAPEQINGTRLTTRTDIYAVGALLWELVIGTWPLRAKNTTEIIQRIAAEFPTEADVPAAADSRWAAVIRKCRAAEPEKRFASARAALDALTTGTNLDLTRAPRRRSRWPALALVGAAAAGGMVWYVRRSGSSAPAVATNGATATSVETVQTDLDRLAYRDAKQACERLARENRDPATTAYLLAHAEAGLGNWKAAAVAAKTALAAPTLARPRRLQLEAIIARASGDLDAALALDEALATTSPDDERITLAYVEALIPLGRAKLAADQLARLDGAKLSPVMAARRDLDRAWALYNTTGFDQAELLRDTDATIKAARELDARVIVGRALCMRATAHLFQGRPDDGKADTREAETLLSAAADTPGLAFVHRVSAIIAANADGDRDKQMSEAQVASGLYEQIDDNVGLSLSLNVEGAVYTSRGNFVDAKKAFKASEEAALRAHREDVANTRARPNLGLVYFELGNIEDTIKLYLDLYAKRGPDTVGLEEGNLAGAYLQNGDLAAARAHLDHSNALLAATKNQTFLSNNISHAAAIAFEADDRGGYKLAMGRAIALDKAAANAEKDEKLIISKARAEFADGTKGVSAQLVAVMDDKDLPPFVSGTLKYLAARALLAEGKRPEALAIRERAAKDAPRLLQFREVRQHARLLDAELAETPAEIDSAMTNLDQLRADQRREGNVLGRWEVELGMAALAKRHGDHNRARELATSVEGETRKAGYLRLARLASALARG